MIGLAAVLMAAGFSGCGKADLEETLSSRTMGIAYMEAGDYEEAIAVFNTALSSRIGKISAIELDICYYKAAAQAAAGDLTEALATYNALLDYDDENGDAYYLRGSLLLDMGEKEQALKDFDAALKQNSEDYELYIHIYEQLAEHSLTEEGEAYLNQAFQIKGNKAEHSAWRGRIYYLLGQYDNAKTELVTAIDKGYAAANLTMARVCEALGEITQAENYYQVYIATGNADAEVMNGLAELEIGMGNYETALDYIKQGLAMETVTNRQALMQNEILVSEYLGDFAHAWEVIQEYADLYPMDEVIQREYTFLKNRQGMKEASEEETIGEETSEEETSEEETTEEDEAQSGQ